MNLYYPLDGDIYSKKIKYRPRTCFLMTKLGKPVPKEIKNIRTTLLRYLNKSRIKVIDANSKVTGRDFLIKIWESIISVPLGIAIITKDLPLSTYENIFYEIGLLQALGKETLIIKRKDAEVPSDFVRTEYITYDRKFGGNIKKYLNTFFDQAEHYATISQELEKNPIIAADYLKRAWLITAKREYKRKYNDIQKQEIEKYGPKFDNKYTQFLKT